MPATAARPELAQEHARPASSTATGDHDRPQPLAGGATTLASLARPPPPACGCRRFEVVSMCGRRPGPQATITRASMPARMAEPAPGDRAQLWVPRGARGPGSPAAGSADMAAAAVGAATHTRSSAS
jgi:hypothetical protein